MSTPIIIFFSPNFRTYVRQFPQTKEENSFVLLSSSGKKGIHLVKKCFQHFHNFAFSVGIFTPVGSIWLFIIEQNVFRIELKPFFWCSVWYYCNFIKLYTWQKWTFPDFTNNRGSEKHLFNTDPYSFGGTGSASRRDSVCVSTIDSALFGTFFDYYL